MNMNMNLFNHNNNSADDYVQLNSCIMFEHEHSQYQTTAVCYYNR